MPSLRFHAAALLSAIALDPLAAHAQALTPAETAQVDRIVTDSLASTGVPSAQIAIVRDGRIVLTRAYGKASAAMPTARTDVPYQIASISKQFTAAALLILEDRGKLSMDDTVAKYIPGVTGGNRITLRQLLSHTSGLRDYWPQDYLFKAMETPVSPQGIVDRWAKAPLDFEPGAQWQYSNTGYVVAGMIVEKVSGEKLLPFLQANVFKPLDMHPIDQDTAIGAKFPVGTHRAALGPVRDATPPARGWLFAAGELSMTAGDLAKWDIARMDRTLLPAEDWQAQETPVKLNDGTTNGYGLGVFTGSTRGHAYVEHSGEAVGFLSENIVYPADKAAVVVLVNADFADATSTISQGIANALFFPPPADPEAAKTVKARAMLDALVAGTPDRSRMTEDANYYFTAQTIGDYRQSLGPLGAPTGFVALGKPRLRGGFVNRNYRVTYPNRTLTIITYAEPGEAGRFEQFLAMPGN